MFISCKCKGRKAIAKVSFAWKRKEFHSLQFPFNVISLNIIKKKFCHLFFTLSYAYDEKIIFSNSIFNWSCCVRGIKCNFLPSFSFSGRILYKLQGKLWQINRINWAHGNLPSIVENSSGKERQRWSWDTWKLNTRQLCRVPLL